MAAARTFPLQLATIRYQLLWLERVWGKSCEQSRVFAKKKKSNHFAQWKYIMSSKIKHDLNYLLMKAKQVHVIKPVWQCPWKSLWQLDKWSFVQTFVQPSQKNYFVDWPHVPNIWLFFFVVFSTYTLKILLCWSNTVHSNMAKIAKYYLACEDTTYMQTCRLSLLRLVPRLLPTFKVSC